MDRANDRILRGGQILAECHALLDAMRAGPGRDAEDVARAVGLPLLPKRRDDS